MTGIYLIKNNINGKCYIGQSVGIEGRFIKHRAGTGNQAIHKAINKYGIDNFSFSVLLECAVERLDYYEIACIAEYNSFDNGYNCTEGGGGNRGRKPSEETKEKIRKSKIGLKASDETKEKMRLSHTGLKESDETREKKRISGMGHEVSEVTRNKLRAANMGKTRAISKTKD